MANYHHDHPHPMPLIVPPPLPDSIQFRPTQRECIMFLLHKFIDKPFPCSHIFDFVDPYDPTHLPSLFQSVELQEHLYLFTKLSKKGKSSSRSGYKNANRIVGKGSWHCDQTGEVTHNGTKIGLVRTLSYREKGSAYDHRFQIHEYSLPENTPLRYDPLNDYVLCHLSRNDRWRNGEKVNPKKYYSCSSNFDVSTRSTCTADINQASAPVLDHAAAIFVRPLATVGPPAEIHREPAAAHVVEGIISTQYDHPVAAACVLDFDEDQLVDFFNNQVDYDAENQDMDVDDGNLKNNYSAQYDHRPAAAQDNGANQILDFLTEEVDYDAEIKEVVDVDGNFQKNTMEFESLITG